MYSGLYLMAVPSSNASIVLYFVTQVRELRPRVPPAQRERSRFPHCVKLLHAIQDRTIFQAVEIPIDAHLNALVPIRGEIFPEHARAKRTVFLPLSVLL